MTVKRVSIAVAALALVVLLVIGLVGLASSGGAGATTPLKLSAAQMQAQLAGSPQPLEALHAQASEILGGGLGALRARLRALRGRPVVINKWASWCVPCREELAVFQRVSLAKGREVAFIGIDSSDSRSAASAFLRAYPLSYPSYFDPSGSLGFAMTDSNNTPVTAFYGRGGRLAFIHQGPYPDAQKLERDIERYALAA
jgi:cytochrome c biogenesis protein CcmG/thiol:disulfide interchange protein DsbE